MTFGDGSRDLFVASTRANDNKKIGTVNAKEKI